MSNRYFVPSITKKSAVIEGADAVHLAKVLRVKPGDTLWLCDGNRFDYQVQVQEVLAKRIACTVLECCENKNEPTLHVTLFVALGKGDKMDWIIQKSVELGVVCIVPFLAERCISRPKSDKQERFMRISEEAAKQSARGIIPTVSPLVSFDTMLQQARQKEDALLFHPGGKPGLPFDFRKEKTLALITGPEGGFAEKEVYAAQETGFRIVGLGPRILRCETAPIAALSAVMASSGEW